MADPQKRFVTSSRTWFGSNDDFGEQAGVGLQAASGDFPVLTHCGPDFPPSRSDIPLLWVTASCCRCLFAARWGPPRLPIALPLTLQVRPGTSHHLSFTASLPAEPPQETNVPRK